MPDPKQSRPFSVSLSAVPWPPGALRAHHEAVNEASMNKAPLSLLIDGPVGVGKTALVRALCIELKDLFDMAVIACDHNCERDAEQLRRETRMDAERIVGMQTNSSS